MSEENSCRATKSIPATAQHRLFRIELRGQVDKGWMTAFDPLSYSSCTKITTIVVTADQAALRGILNRLWDLNLDILSMIEIARPAIRNGGK